jgi:L,D-transpeptidase catalytic domain
MLVKMSMFRPFILTGSLLVTALTSQLVHGETEIPPYAEPVSGAVVCAPGVYPIPPDDCLLLGPSQDLTDAFVAGIPYPLPFLPSFAPDPTLAEVPYRYLKLSVEGKVFYFFNSLSDAMASSVSGVSIGPGFVYLSYVDRVENDEGAFYLLRSGAWVRADFSARAALHMPFQGLLFSSTPATSFGWVLGEVSSYRSPEYGAEKTGNLYHRYQVVQVYKILEADGNTWLMIGKDEWLDYHHVSRVDPSKFPPEGVIGGRWIEVNLDEQILTAYEDNRLVFATLISSGTGAWATRPGLFQIYKKLETETMSGATEADRSDYYYLQDVPWTMYFDEGRALHGAYWHDGFGYPRSHGCVNLALGDAHWLFDWALEGDYVYIHDPSVEP